MKKYFLAIIFLFSLSLVSAEVGERVVVGAERMVEYGHFLEGRRVGVLVNHTSRVGTTHLVDTLLANGVDVTVIFSPATGFRGEDVVVAGRDSYLGITIKPLFSAPKTNDVFGCDVILCDLQCGSVRCEEFVALCRMMGVCAYLDVPVVVLDRPLMGRRGVDGAIPELRYCAEGDVLPLPLLCGMTLGEVAQMINGEGWLADGAKCLLTVIPYVGCVGYDVDQEPMEPMSLMACGLAVEVPIVNEEGSIDLSAVVEAYANRDAEEEFFIGEEFCRQIGASYVRDMIEQGYAADVIEAMWSADTERFQSRREPYLLY